MSDSSSFPLELRLTPEQQRKVERLAAREGLSSEEGVLRAVEQGLRAEEAQEAEEVLRLARSVYDDLDASTRDAVEALALDCSRFFGRAGA